MAIVSGSPRQSLLDLPRHSICAVEAVETTEEHALRLAGLGLTAGRELRIVKCGEPTIVQVYGTRIGLARTLARDVRVVPKGAKE